MMGEGAGIMVLEVIHGCIVPCCRVVVLEKTKMCNDECKKRYRHAAYFQKKKVYAQFQAENVVTVW